MKRLILPVVIALTMLMTSCIGGDVYETGGSSYPELSLQTFNITVHPRQWRIDGVPGEEGCTLMYDCSIPALTQDVIEKGMVQVVYYYYDEVLGIYKDHPLPYILPMFDTPSNRIETYRYFCTSGQISFIIEDSDFQCYRPAYDINFKISILRNR